MKRYVLTRCAKWLGIFLLAGGVIFYILQLAPPDPSQCVLANAPVLCADLFDRDVLECVVGIQRSPD